MISGANALPSVSLLMEKIDKLAAEVEHLRTSKNSLTQTPKGKAFYGHHNTGTRLHRSEQRDGGGFRHSNVNTECSKCQGTGHNDPACKWNGEGRVNPGVKCQLCKQTGHTAVNCADKKKRTAPKCEARQLGNSCEPTPPHIMGPLRSSTVDQHDYDLCASDSTCINDNSTAVLGSLLYLYLHFQDVKIAALLDSVSTTNLMSFALYNRLPNSVKSAFK